MRACIQRVKNASVTVDKEVVGDIGQGLLVFFGVKKGDSAERIPWMISKVLNLRIFCDDEGKMNSSVKDISGEVLVVSQFTLYGDCTNGRRPSFSTALNFDEAEKLYDQFLLEMKRELKNVQSGIFGASMQVSLVNDGPVTLILE